MAITVTPKYKPFTYKELVKPLEGYWEDYKKHEAAIGELGTSLAALDYIIQAEPENSPLRKKYADYQQQLTQATDALADGYNAKDRDLLRSLKSSFASDITPIGTAYKRRQTLQDEQRKQEISHPSIRYSKKASEASVTDFIDDPNWSYTSFIGDNITKAVEDFVSPLASILQSVTEGEDVGNYKDILWKQYGATVQDVQDYLYNGKGKLAQYFRNAEDRAVQASGVLNWDDPNNEFLNEAYKFAALGIPKAIGKSDIVPGSTTKSPSDGGDTPGVAKGIAIDFTTSRIYTSPDKKAKEKQEAYVKTITGGQINKSAEELELEGQLLKAGLDPNDADKYVEYLNKLAEAHRKDTERNVERRPSQITTPETDKVKDEYSHFANLNISRREIEKYQRAAQKRKEVLRYSAEKDSNIGIYGGTLVEDARIGTLLEHKQATDEVFIGNPLWEPKTNESVLTSLNHDYHNMSKSKDGNGLYKIDITTGEKEYVKEEDAEKILNPSSGAFISYTGKYGMLINKDGEFYRLKGSGITGAAEDAVQIRNSLRDFSPETVKEYTETIKAKEGNATDLATTDKYYSGEELQNFFTKLKQDNRLVQDKYNSNNLYCYLKLKTKDKSGKTYTDIVKVLYDRSGVFLGTTSLNSELGSFGTPSSELYTHYHLNKEAQGRADATINTSTSVTPRSRK